MPKAKRRATPKASQLPDKDMILMEFIKEVPFSGWSESALKAVAEKMETSCEDLELVLPGGLMALSAAFAAWADAAMLAQIKKDRLFARRKVREKIEAGVLARLDALAPHKEALRKSLFFMARPGRSARAAQFLWGTADTLWHAAGDDSVDFNHYTKRILLSAVLSATTLYWLQDESPAHEKTQHFLQERLADVLKLGSMAGKLKDTPFWLQEGLSLLRRFSR